MQEQHTQDNVKLEVKIQASFTNLPPRCLSNCHPKESYRILTNAVQIQNHQGNHPKVHLFRIDIKPPISENDGDALEYIHLRLNTFLKKYTYLKKKIIMTSEQFTKDKRMIKVVFNGRPIEVWLYHHKSFRFGRPFDELAFWRGNNYLKQILAQQLSELNFTCSNDKNQFYIPKVKCLSGLPYSTLSYFSTSFSWCDNRMFMIVKQRSKIIEDNTVLNTINTFYKVNTHLTKQEKHEYVNRLFQNRQVISLYGKRSIHKIDSIDFQTKVADIKIIQRDIKSGKIIQISLADYYRTKYQLQITNRNQPLMKIKSNKPVYLLPEFVSLLVNLKQIQIPKFQRIQELIKLKSQDYSHQNNAFLSNLHEPLSTNAFHKLREIGISMDKQFTTGKAYLFDYPTIETASGQKILIFKGNQFDFQGHNIYSAKTDLNICLIYPSSLGLSHIQIETYNSSQKIGLRYNITPYTYIANSAQEIISYIKEIIYIQKLAQRSKITNIFWIVIKDEFRHLYSLIKSLTFNCNIESISQITLQSTLQLPNSGTIISKVVQQMAAKINNPIWRVLVPQDHHILLIGIAVQNGIVTFCSNINSCITEFHSDFHELKPYQSLSMYIRNTVKTCLQEYIVNVEAFPTEVIILRFENKISQQQQDAQVRQIKSALSAIKNIEFGINYYAISYSHSLKVYLQAQGRLTRPLQGMVISQHIVSDGNFYLLNENGKNKDPIIVHYRSIYRKSPFKGYQFQQFLYDQTFNYYNFQGTVFIPGVLKLAKKLASALKTYKCDKHVLKALSYNLYYL